MLDQRPPQNWRSTAGAVTCMCFLPGHKMMLVRNNNNNSLCEYFSVVIAAVRAAAAAETQGFTPPRVAAPGSDSPAVGRFLWGRSCRGRAPVTRSSWRWQSQPQGGRSQTRESRTCVYKQCVFFFSVTCQEIWFYKTFQGFNLFLFFFVIWLEHLSFFYDSYRISMSVFVLFEDLFFTFCLRCLIFCWFFHLPHIYCDFQMRFGEKTLWTLQLSWLLLTNDNDFLKTYDKDEVTFWGWQLNPEIDVYGEHVEIHSRLFLLLSALCRHATCLSFY